MRIPALLAALALAGCRGDAVRANPARQVVIYTAANPGGLDTALLERPTWGVIQAMVIRQNGSIDPSVAVHWRTADSTKVRLRKVTAQSVVIEAPRTAKLGTTRVTASLSARYDTLVAVVREGLAGLELDSSAYHVPADSTRRICAAWRTSTGQRFGVANDAASCP